MFDSTHSLSSSSVTGTFAFDRRVDARYVLEAGSDCVAAQGGQETFSVQIINISAGGLALLTDRRIERSTLLSIVLPSRDEFGSRRLVMSVKSADPQPPGSWKIGCEFARKLTALELLALL